MAAPFYVVETSGYPTHLTGERKPVSRWGNPEVEVQICGPNGSVLRSTVVVANAPERDARLARARSSAASLASILNAEARA